MRQLDFNKEGVLKPALHSVEMIIRHEPRLRGLPQLNEFTGTSCSASCLGR
jgi:hypothetical protein